MNRVFISWAAAAFFFLGPCLQPFSVALADILETAVCSPTNLKRLINNKTKELGEKRKWESVEFVVNLNVKLCIEKELLARYSIKRFSENKIFFQGKNYLRVSDAFFDAPASDHGWATIYRNKDNTNSPSFLKIAFNVYPDGEINFINLFLIEFNNKIPTFYEINEELIRTSASQCLGCHIKAPSNFLFKSKIN